MTDRLRLIPAIAVLLAWVPAPAADHDFFDGVVRQLGDASSQDCKVDERALIMSGPAKYANDESDVMGQVRRPGPLTGASKTV